MGSHLDTQPTGGKFDGALGVLCGLEVMRVLQEEKIDLGAPVEVVDWTDEEGSRFGTWGIGSSVWSGGHDKHRILNLQDKDGITVKEAIASIHAAGPHPAKPFPVDAYFELHIEQGPILEKEEKVIGIVTGAQGLVWYDAVITGQDAHAGTTPPYARKDALVAAAKVISLVDDLMRARGDLGRGTVGKLEVFPNSRNVIPGEVRFSVEFRHPDDDELLRVKEQFERMSKDLVEGTTGCKWKLTELFTVPVQPFDPSCVDLVAQSAARNSYPSRTIVSGAGHDAVYMSKSARIPTAMIFTPCKDGLSHNELESITPLEAEQGCQVLLDVVISRAK